MLYTYYSCIAITLLLFILNFKILKSTFFVTLPKINIYQKEVVFYLVEHSNFTF
jgi:hypothetical protein